MAAGCGDEGSEAGESTTAAPATTASGDGTATLPAASGPPPPLVPGTYRSPEGFTPVTTLTVPAGWYGSGSGNGFGIGKGNDPVAEDFASVGIFVHRVDRPLQAARSAFESLLTLRVMSERPARLGGASGRTYTVSVPGEHAILEPLGVFADIPHGDAEVTIVDVDGETLLISLQRWKTTADRDEGRRVVKSFRFSP